MTDQVPTNEARQGVTHRNVRLMLSVSLVLAIVVLAVIGLAVA